MRHADFARVVIIAFFMGCLTIVNLFMWLQLFRDFSWMTFVNLLVTNSVGYVLGKKGKREYDAMRAYLESRGPA